MIMMQLL